MILMYHKVDIVSPTVWWIPVDVFARQLDELDGREFVHLSDYDPGNPRHIALTFDDAYENVYRRAFPELRKRGLPFELFVIGDRIGDWNDFDRQEPLTRFAGLAHLQEMAAGGARIQWHTSSHPELPSLDDAALARELAVPETLRTLFPAPHLAWFSYPSGAYDARVADAARARFEGAVAVLDGEQTDRWTLERVTVDPHTRFA